MSSAIVTKGLCKTYGKVTALDGLDLDIREGTVSALLGPNGAGKTTAVRLLATLARPDSGTATVCGVDVVRSPREIRRMIGLTGQYAAVDEVLTGRENLAMIGRLGRLSRADTLARTEEMLERFDLVSVADRRAKTYSGGLRRRLDLAAGMMNRPRLLFLDEPTTGLDPAARLNLWSLIEELAGDGTTVLLTTQYLEEADRLAEAITVLEHGKAIAHGTPRELKSRVSGDYIEIALNNLAQTDAARAVVERTVGTDSTADRETGVVTVPVSSAVAALPRILTGLEEAEVGVLDVTIRRPTLDDAFLALIGHGTDESGSATSEEK